MLWASRINTVKQMPLSSIKSCKKHKVSTNWLLLNYYLCKTIICIWKKCFSRDKKAKWFLFQVNAKQNVQYCHLLLAWKVILVLLSSEISNKKCKLYAAELLAFWLNFKKCKEKLLLFQVILKQMFSTVAL